MTSGGAVEGPETVHEKLDRLIETMTPEVRFPSEAAALLSQRNARRRADLLEEFGALTGEQIAEERSRARNRHALAARWRKEGRLFGVPYRAQTLYPAQLAYAVERNDLGIHGGLQDQYAATFGGFNFIEMDAEHVVVNPLRIAPDVVHELEHNMLLAYTGRTRASDHIIDDQTDRFRGGDARALEGLRMQKELAVEMKNALLQRRLTDFGELLGAAWEFKKQMSPRISTDFIDEAYAEARRQGALGGKVTGAGGGGYMLFFCPFQRRHRVAEALGRMGATVAEFEFCPRGLTTWSVDE